MNDSRTGYEVIQLRARDLRPGDVILRRVEGAARQEWAVVEGVFTDMHELIEVAEDVLDRYSRKEATNIGVSNFIRGSAVKSSREYGKRLERVGAGLSVLVNTRLTNDPDDGDNWNEFRSLDLVSVQAHKS